MVAHLTIPYRWIECEDGSLCSSIVHHEHSANVLNAYPIEWVSALLGDCVVGENSFAWTDKDRRFHCDDGPAMMTDHGALHWYFHGVQHRSDGPAYVRPHNSKYVIAHRSSFPFKFFRRRQPSFNAAELWYVNGELHREDGPALTTEGFAYYWYQNNDLHRENGLPAMVRFDGEKEWWVNGKQVESSEKPFKRLITSFLVDCEVFFRKLFRVSKRIRIGKHKK